jgi:protein gp37
MGIARYEGLTHKVGDEIRWTGRVRFVSEVIDQPIHWKRPRRIFVNSMSDVFHESVPDEWIDHIFSIMVQCPQHTFQLLTKRSSRMRTYMSTVEALDPKERTLRLVKSMWRENPARALIESSDMAYVGSLQWPPKNVWLLVSVEDQESADARIPDLMETPAAIRGISYEPALGPIDFVRQQEYGTISYLSGMARPDAPVMDDPPYREWPGLDWVIIGGESGPGARPFVVDWARDTVQACQAAGVKVFVKQMGSYPVTRHPQYFRDFNHWVNKASSWLDEKDVCFDAKGRRLTRGDGFQRARDEGAFPVYIYVPLHLVDRKGDNIDEFPDGCRVQQMPSVA